MHFLLGPATVALAIPVARLLKTMRDGYGALAVSLLTGSLTAAGSAVFIADLLQASEQTILSLAPKSVTTPIAMGIAERVGGLPSLTAVCVIMTGVIGAMFGPYVLNAARVTSWRARGSRWVWRRMESVQHERSRLIKMRVHLRLWRLV